MNKFKNQIMLFNKIIIQLFVIALLFVANSCKGQIAENKEIARNVVEKVFNQSNIDEVDNYFNENYIFHHPLFEYSGIESVKNQQVLYATNALSGINMEAFEIMAENDLVATRFTVNGNKHVDNFMGVPPTGKPLKITGIIISRIENGKISEEWEFADLIGVRQQFLGADSLNDNHITPFRAKPEDYTWGQTMSTKTNKGNLKKNKAMIRSMVDNLFNGDNATFSDYFTKNFLFHAPSLPYLKNIDDFEKYWKKIGQATKNLYVSIDDMIAERDLLTIRWSVQCHHLDADKQITEKGIAIFKIANGKIEEGWLGIDMIGLLQQIGMFPVPPK